MTAASGRDFGAYVWVAPGRLGGKPCVGGHRLSVDQVTRYVWGDSGSVDVAVISHDLTRAQVLTACWFQAVHGTRTWRQRWGRWAVEHCDAMWSGRWDQVPDPPNN